MTVKRILIEFFSSIKRTILTVKTETNGENTKETKMFGNPLVPAGYRCKSLLQ